jgi:hypothetical protein
MRSIAIPWERRGWLREIRIGRWLGRLAVALAIVLALVWTWRSADRSERTRVTRTRIERVRRAVLAFQADFGRCPTGIAELLAPHEHEPYLREPPRDGWGRALWLRCPGRTNPDGADIRSRGPDGTWFGRDEIE